MKKMTSYKARTIEIILGVMIFISLLQGVFAWSNTTLWNGTNFNTIENLTYSGNQNFTRWLLVPQGSIIANAFLNLSGYKRILTQYLGNTTLFYSTYYEMIGSFDAGSPYTNAFDNDWDTYAGGAYSSGFNLSIIENFTLNNTYPQNITWQSKGQYMSGTNFNTISYWDFSTNGWVFLGYSNCNTTLGGGNSIFICNFTIPSSTGVNRATNEVRINTTLNSKAGTVPSARYYEGRLIIFNSSTSSINLTTNRNQLFYYPNNFSQINNRTSNFASTINNYLSVCSYVGGFCSVPINFSSQTAGILQYLDLFVNDTLFQENSQEYNPSATEDTSQSFSINISYNSVYFTTANASLIYNGTSYAGTQVGTGNNILFNTTLTTPIVSSSINKSFYWQIILNNGTDNYYNSSVKNQTVLPLTTISLGSSCSVGLSPNFYFIFRNENNLSAVNSSVQYNIQYGSQSNQNSKTANGTINGVTEFSICINNSNDIYIGYGEFQYSSYGSESGGFVNRRYYIFPSTHASNVSINSTLFYLTSGEATAFQFTLENNYFVPQQNSYLSLLRWYPDLNLYKVVEVGKTDSDGKTIMNVKTQTVDYRIGAYDSSGNLLQLFPAVRFICTTNPCEYSVILSPSNNNQVYELGNLQQSLTFNRTTKTFVYVWNDPTQATKSINLTVYKDNYDSSLVICSTKGDSFTGVLTCDVSAYTGTVRAVITRTASPDVPINTLTEILDKIFPELANGKSTILIIGFGFCLFLVLIGSFNPIIAVIMAILGLIPIVLLGGINWGIFSAICLIGGLIIHFARRT